MSISVKTRLGYSDPDEFYELMEIFNEFPLSELIIHTRIKEDMYKGEPRLDYYSYAIENAKFPLVYNGNIFSEEYYKSICGKLGQKLAAVMLGRGLIADPGLPQSLQGGDIKFDYKKFWELHDLVYHEYQKVIFPDINTLYRIKELWSYWKVNFDNSDRIFRRIVKAKKYNDYESIINDLK